MKRFLWIMVMGLVVAGCTQPSAPPASPTPTPGPAIVGIGPVSQDSVRFVVIGDAGMGNEQQAAVADGILRVCEERGCNFVLENGDNIYSSGVRSAYDPQFESKFETPYQFLDLPFYLVLGNHDNGDGSGTNPAVGDYQVDYAKRTDRLSDKWNMPARYYKIEEGPVTIFGIDSGPMEISQTPVWAPGSRGALMEAWFAAEMSKVTSKWVFAFAHHAYISSSTHGNAGMFDNVVGRGLAYKLFLEKHICAKVQVMFAGHDHNLQWLKPTQGCGRTEFIVSGAGGASLYGKAATEQYDPYFEDYTHHGFFWIDVTGNTFTGVAFDDEGEKLFERTFTTS